MNGTERAVRILALGAAHPRRARFIEEWTADAAASRALGLSRLEIVVACARVAAFLAGVRLRTAITRRRRGPELIVTGSALGFASVVADVSLSPIMPFVLLLIGWLGWHTIRAWIDGAA